jgi:hypothetical protein
LDQNVNKAMALQKGTKKSEDKKPNPAEKPVSLAPLTFDQAVSGLLALKSEVRTDQQNGVHAKPRKASRHG